VRRTRTPVSAAEPTRAETGTGLSAEPALSSPRVFRVQALHAASSAGLPETVQGPPVAVHTRTATSGTAAAPRSRPHIATAQRPGPVTHVVLASPARRETKAAEPKLNTLIAELASVGQILDAAERAQSFEIVDRRTGALWQRLARRAEDIREDIEARLR
jgi:hypothetical protein